MDSRANASPFLDQDFVNKQAKMEGDIAETEKQRTSEVYRAAAGAMALAHLKNPFKGEQEYIEAMGDIKREQQGALLQFQTVEQDTQKRVEQFFSPLAAGKALPTTQQVDFMIDFFRGQAEAQFALHKMVEERTSAQAMRPGTVGAPAKK